MLYREIIAVCSQIPTKQKNTLYQQNARFLMRTPSCWVMTPCYSLISPQCSGRMTLSMANATKFIPPTLPWLAHQLFLWLAHQSFHWPQTAHTINKYLIFCLPSHSFWTSGHMKIMAPCSVQTLAATHPVTECHIMVPCSVQTLAATHPVTEHHIMAPCSVQTLAATHPVTEHIMAPYSVQTLAATHPVTECHIPAEQNLQPHQCQKLTTHKICNVKTAGVYSYSYHCSVRTVCL
jgi:hypothetical protein